MRIQRHQRSNTCPYASSSNFATIRLLQLSGPSRKKASLPGSVWRQLRLSLASHATRSKRLWSEFQIPTLIPQFARALATFLGLLRHPGPAKLREEPLIDLYVYLLLRFAATVAYC